MSEKKNRRKKSKKKIRPIDPTALIRHTTDDVCFTLDPGSKAICPYCGNSDVVHNGTTDRARYYRCPRCVTPMTRDSRLEGSHTTFKVLV